MSGHNLQPYTGLVVPPQQQQRTFFDLVSHFVQGVALGCLVYFPLHDCCSAVLGQLLVPCRLLQHRPIELELAEARSFSRVWVGSG